jgi:hypothetical protein
MSVGTRFSAVARCIAAHNPGTGSAGSHEPSCSVVDDEWQCGQSMTTLLISQNRAPENLFAGGTLRKLSRNLTEPARPVHHLVSGHAR